jgi:hypothetical protein
LSDCRPELLLERGAGNDIVPYLKSTDAETRGLAALACGNLRLTIAEPLLRGLTTDAASVSLCRDGELVSTTVAALAQSALEMMCR